MPLLSQYPVRNANVITGDETAITAGETVLVLPERGQIKVLNEVGARVWALADGARDIGAIVDAVCDEYDVERARAETDTLLFIADLEAKGLASLATVPRPVDGPAGRPGHGG
jgi:hypothetical protein